MKTKIAITTANLGHLSLAEAIEASLSNEQDYDVVRFFRPVVGDAVYRWFYRITPQLFVVPYFLGRLWPIKQIVELYYQHYYLKDLAAFFEKEQPALCISTFFAYNPALTQLAIQHKIPVINVLANPRSTHPLEVGKPPLVTTSFDEAQTKAVQAILATADVRTTGWFVKPAFEAHYDQFEVRQKLGLEPQRLTLLLVGGSDGNPIILTLIKMIQKLSDQHHRDLNVIVVCGNNSTLLNQLQYLNKTQSGQQNQIYWQIVGFTTELHTFMQASDLVIGKAGPNTLFESVATSTPFMATTHISGQETGNLDIIKDARLGYVCEELEAAQTTLSEILENPGQLTQFAPTLKAIADHNRTAKKKILAVINELLHAKN